MIPLLSIFFTIVFPYIPYFAVEYNSLSLNLFNIFLRCIFSERICISYTLPLPLQRIYPLEFIHFYGVSIYSWQFSHFDYHPLLVSEEYIRYKLFPLSSIFQLCTSHPSKVLFSLQNLLPHLSYEVFSPLQRIVPSHILHSQENFPVFCFIRNVLSSNNFSSRLFQI